MLEAKVDRFAGKILFVQKGRVVSYFFVQKRANECNIFVAFCTFPFSFVFANTHLSARGVYEAMTTVARYEPGVWAFYHSATFLTIVQCTFYRCYNQLIHIDPPTHQYRKEVAASRQVLYMSGVISLAVCSNNQIRHNCFGRSLISQQSCLCRYYHECS